MELFLLQDCAPGKTQQVAPRSRCFVTIVMRHLCVVHLFILKKIVNASVDAGIIVAIAFVAISIIVYLVLSFNRTRISAEKERLKNQFSKRIVSTFSIDSGGEAITMEKITEKFKRIDSGKTEGGG
mmetsp:Transcript_48337/g.58310  ORF Transcript_48337/g.58310 Transcript_48337/m.58310 type:complete len:126 (+) Transcript_48337:811-1188(+)